MLSLTGCTGHFTNQTWRSTFTGIAVMWCGVFNAMHTLHMRGRPSCSTIEPHCCLVVQSLQLTQQLSDGEKPVPVPTKAETLETWIVRAHCDKGSLQVRQYMLCLVCAVLCCAPPEQTFEALLARSCYTLNKGVCQLLCCTVPLQGD